MTSLRNCTRIEYRLWQFSKSFFHLFRRFKIKTISLKMQTFLIINCLSRLNAKENIMRPRILPIHIVAIICCDHTDVQFPRKLHELFIQGVLFWNSVILQLNVKIVRTQYVLVIKRFFPRPFVHPFLEQIRYFALHTGRKPYQPTAVLLQEIDIYPRFIIKTFCICFCHETYQIAISVVVLRKQDEMERCLFDVLTMLFFQAASGGYINFTPDNRLNAGFCNFLVEFNRSEEIAVVSYRNCRHPVSCGLLHQLCYANGSVKQAEFRMQMEGNVV